MNCARLLAACGIKVSTSGAGKCYDNAPTESFWDKLRTELVYLENFATRQEARAKIFDYIECFYNRVRHTVSWVTSALERSRQP
ncbi:MAG: IS3 family transposase [bacterium]|jgi:putative transposase